MAYQLATAYVAIVPSLKGVGEAITSAFGKAGNNAGVRAGAQAGSGFASGLGAKGAIIGAASSITSKAMDLIGSSIGSAVQRTDMMNNFPKVMSNLGFSSEDAAKSVQKISRSLDGLPTASSAITGMVQQLAPLTPSLNDATNIALSFNDAMLAGGASTVEQENALMQYTQMLAAGKVDMMAWRSMQDAMPGQLNQVAEAMLGVGKNSNDLYNAMKSGTISFDDFNNALVRLDSQGFGKYASFSQQAKSATQGIGTAVENVKNRVAKAMQKVIEAIGVEDISGAINNFSSQFGKVGDAVASVVVRAKTYLQGLWAVFGQTGTLSSFAALWGTVKDAVSGFVQSASSVGGALARMVPQKAIASTLKGVTDALSWFIQHTNVTGIIMGVGGAFMAFKAVSGITSMLEGVPAALSGVMAFTGNVGKLMLYTQEVGGIGAAIKIMVGNMRLVKAAQIAWNAVTTAGRAIMGAFNAVLAANPIGLLVTAIAAVVAALVWFFTQTETGRQLWASFTAWLTQTWQTISTTAQTLFSGMGAFFATLWNGIQSTGIAIWTAISGFFIGIWTAISGFFIGIWTGIQTGISVGLMEIQGVWMAIWPAVSGFFIGIWTAISGFFIGIWNGIQSGVSSGLGAIQGVWNGIWSAISGFFSGIWSGISGFFNGVWGGLQGAISGGLGAIRGVWNGAWSGIRSYFSAVWNGMRAGAAAGVSAILGVVSNVGASIRGAFAGAGSWLVGAGTQIMNGLVAGIESGIAWVRAKIASVADIIPGWLKEKLGIHSPSRVMRDQIGIMISRGLAIGIVKGTKYVSQAAQGLQSAAMINAVSGYDNPALSATSATPRFAPSAGGIGGGTTWNITTSDPLAAAAEVDRRQRFMWV